MTPFLLYVARCGLYLGLFYTFYLLVMRRTTFFRLNRALLLAGSYLCLLLPLIRLRTVTATRVASTLTMAGSGAETASQAALVGFPWKSVLFALFLAGSLATLVLYILSAVRMGRLIKKGEPSEQDGCTLILLEEDVPSFSWGRMVAMSRKDLLENPEIFTHERMHVQHHHSRDLLLFLPFQLLCWWNPLVWITREELRLLHEYEADEGVIRQCIDASRYQLLLVRKAVGEQRFTLASGFQHTNLKHRIAMMLKPSSSRWMRWSYLALLPVLAAFMLACNPTKESAEPAESGSAPAEGVRSAGNQETIPFQLIEKKPSFNGGDANEFSKWVNSQLKYPDQAKKDGAQGRVTLQFTVGADGVVRNVKVLRGVREDLDAEAVRVIFASPKWEPGRQGGEAVAVTYTYPVIFQLR